MNGEQYAAWRQGLDRALTYRLTRAPDVPDPRGILAMRLRGLQVLRDAHTAGQEPPEVVAEIARVEALLAP